MSEVKGHAPGTPTWFDCMTPDLEGARKFYGEVFGWTFLVGPEQMGYYTMCQLRGKNVAGMGLRPENAPYPTAWSCYFDSDDADAHAARVRESGGRIVMGPMDVANSGRMLVCVDPAGATFGFWQAGEHKGAQIVNEPGAMAWCETMTRDGEKARPFYEKVLGAESRKMEGMQYYTFQKPGEDPFCGILYMDDSFPKEIPSHWMPYFAVPNTDESCERIKALGGKVMHGPFDSPYGRIAIVTDPYGASFSIIQLTQAAA